MQIPTCRTWVAGCLVMALASMVLSAVGIQGAQPQAERNTQTQPLIASLKGPDLFRAYCASCHGGDAKGSGPVAPALTTKPADLTTIAQRNGGVFPSKRVRNIIAGDELVLAHGSREMPVWGPIFHKVEWDRDFGEIRLQNIAKYLESIQQK